MNDFFYETVFGVFECKYLNLNKHYLLFFNSDDEENTGFRKQFHRSYLKNETKMHVFEDFLSKEIEKKVRINFRISYLRDTVLASKIDESLLTTLNTMIYYNNFEIIYYILAEKSKLNHLIETFSLNKLEEKVNFFSEFFSILKLLQGSNDLKLLLNELISNTSFLLQNIKSFILIENSSSFRSKILENMLFLAQSNPEKFMLFFLTQKKEIKEFLQALRECFKQFEDEGLVIQVCFLIKISSNMNIKIFLKKEL